MDDGKAPKQMIDPNTKTDYNKMKRLLQLDKLDGNRKGIIRRITEEGSIVSNLYETFPASEIVKPEYFPSLLFYYGMLTIKDTFGDQLLLGIPNNNVRRQYYGDFGSYLKYNTPHKASFYLRAGLPIIVWKESAIAPLVEERGVGFAINSLKELPGRLAGISEEEYAGMLAQTKQMAIAINNGENLKNAIQECSIV